MKIQPNQYAQLAVSGRTVQPTLAGGNWDSISFSPGVLPFPSTSALGKRECRKPLRSPLLVGRLEILGRTFLLQWEVLLGNKYELWDNTVAAPHLVG